jgi:hypothetical protein
LRIFECASKIDLVRLLLKLRGRYDSGTHPAHQQHKISFAVIGGHGTKNSIHFGASESLGSLTIEDLQGRGTTRVNSFFEQHATLILVSCTTGAEGGIGEKLSHTLGVTVIAPDVPTRMSSMRVTKQDSNNLVFNVEYKDKGHTRMFTS